MFCQNETLNLKALGHNFKILGASPPQKKAKSKAQLWNTPLNSQIKMEARQSGENVLASQYKHDSTSWWALEKWLSQVSSSIMA